MATNITKTKTKTLWFSLEKHSTLPMKLFVLPPTKTYLITNFQEIQRTVQHIKNQETVNHFFKTKFERERD